MENLDCHLSLQLSCLYCTIDHRSRYLSFEIREHKMTLRKPDQHIMVYLNSKTDVNVVIYKQNISYRCTYTRLSNFRIQRYNLHNRVSPYSFTYYIECGFRRHILLLHFDSKPLIIKEKHFYVSQSSWRPWVSNFNLVTVAI